MAAVAARCACRLAERQRARLISGKRMNHQGGNAVSDNAESAVGEGPGRANPVGAPGGQENPDVVLCGVDGPVAVVTINRPAARNAVNGAVAAGMAAAFDDLEARPGIQVIVLTGAGGTFCAGMDLKGFLAGENQI